MLCSRATLVAVVALAVSVGYASAFSMQPHGLSPTTALPPFAAQPPTAPGGHNPSRRRLLRVEQARV